jgi:hypothetical protein
MRLSMQISYGIGSLRCTLHTTGLEPDRHGPKLGAGKEQILPLSPVFILNGREQQGLEGQVRCDANVRVTCCYCVSQGLSCPNGNDINGQNASVP